MKNLKIVSFLVLAAWIPGVAFGQTYLITHVSGDANPSATPKINDLGDITWYGGISTDILFFDAATGVVTNISNTPGQTDIQPMLNDNGDIAWWVSATTDAYQYSASTGVITKLVEIDSRAQRPVINAPGQVVYMAGGTASPGVDILQFDGASGTTTAITNTATNDFFPWNNDQGDIVWQGGNLSGDAIYLYEASAGVPVLLDTTGAYPRLNENLDVVWQHHDGNDWEILLYDSVTDSVVQLTDNTTDDEKPQINDLGDVAWFGGDGSDREIFLYDAQTGNTVQVTSNTGIEDLWFSCPCVNFNNRQEIVWVAIQPGNHRVMHYSHATGVVTQISDSAYPAFDVSINNQGDIVWLASGHQGLPAGLFLAKRNAIDVEIDIKPGSEQNSINLGSMGNVPVAILSSADFDATSVDPTTVTLAGALVKIKKNGFAQASVKDVDGDGLADLLVHVVTAELELDHTDTEAELKGETFGGVMVQGVDAVRIVP